MRIMGKKYMLSVAKHILYRLIIYAEGNLASQNTNFSFWILSIIRLNKTDLRSEAKQFV